MDDNDKPLLTGTTLAGALRSYLLWHEFGKDATNPENFDPNKNEAFVKKWKIAKQSLYSAGERVTTTVYRATSLSTTPPPKVRRLKFVTGCELMLKVAPHRKTGYIASRYGRREPFPS